MKLQIICNTRNINAEGYEVVYSDLNNPSTFDAFNVNIIDLQNNCLWVNDETSISSINCIDDFKSLQILIEATTKSNIIIALPQNYTFYCNKSIYGSGYNSSIVLKNNLANLECILSKILPKYHFKYGLAFENSETNCGDSSFKSAFYFSGSNYAKLTCAKDSGKATTIKLTDRCILTTLKLSDHNCKLKDFLDIIGFKQTDKINIPDWLNDFLILDDKAQRDVIDKNTNKISELQEEINKSKEKLNKNLYYKSVLTETGENLVEVVFEMLGKMLDFDLSEFVDVKREDFRIKLKDITFIGEIKGINTNVKSGNISQVENHCRIYEDEAVSANENIKGLLVINTQRTKKLEEREAVHVNSIELAKKYGVLIITTDKLLTMFEKFLSEEITTEQVIGIFKTQTGLIELNL